MYYYRVAVFVSAVVAIGLGIDAEQFTLCGLTATIAFGFLGILQALEGILEK